MLETRTARVKTGKTANKAPVSTSPEGAKSTSGRALPVDGKSVPDAYFRRYEISQNESFYRIKKDGEFAPVTWGEAHPRVVGIFLALRKAGIKKGQKVCIMSQSRPEWMLADLAIMSLGAVTVPIYHSSSIEDITYILEHSEAQLVFAEDAGQCRKLAEVKKNKGNIPPVVTMDGAAFEENGLNATPLATFAPPASDKESHEEMRKAAAALLPSDVASIVYTSGTTGRPKGAVLLHSNFTTEMRSVVQDIELQRDDLTLTFLPFAHIFGRIESQLPIFAGVTLAFAESINAVPQNIQEVKPTLLVSVPRIYEKIYAKIQSEVESSPDLKKNIFKWAVAVGRDVARRRADKEPIPVWLNVKFRIADQLVFSKVRQKLGGNIRFTVSGGAPLSRELCEFLHACGIKVLEGYGLTETTAAVFVNRPDDYQFGTVGKPMDSTEIRIAADGEIQVRGPLIFKEYYNNKEATAEVFTEDGYFCTGDIGEIDGRGFLRITDRKKELIVTSGGKKIAPQKLENMIKASRFLSNGMVYGDKQKYLVALVTLNEPEIAKWAKENGVSGTSPEEIAKAPQVEELIAKEMKEINSSLASFESIKKFKILPRDFTIESGELTPSMKLKRKIVTERYKDVIQSMY